MTSLPASLLHDAEIDGLSFDSKQAALCISCCSTTGASFKLIFCAVRAWRLSEFTDQNVVFALTEHERASWLESEQGRDDYYGDLVATIDADVRVFQLDSSVGLGGAIVAANCVLEETIGELVKHHYLQRVP